MTSNMKISAFPKKAPPDHLSKKEQAKALRHEAYVRAKEFRKTDPRQIAMAEKLKEQRHDAYQKAKELGKIYRAELKKAAHEKAARKKAVKQRSLKAMVVPGSTIKSAAKSAT